MTIPELDMLEHCFSYCTLHVINASHPVLLLEYNKEALDLCHGMWSCVFIQYSLQNSNATFHL